MTRSPSDGLTHASFFSGVGGLDLGLARAGWKTVSFSEIDPYANAVLAHHWPEVPNLGDITQIETGRAAADGAGPGRDVDDQPPERDQDGRHNRGGHTKRRRVSGHDSTDGDGGADGSDDQAALAEREGDHGGPVTDPADQSEPLRRRRSRGTHGVGTDATSGAQGQPQGQHVSDAAHRAVLWSGGFPCQDLSVAGKRAGFAGERSSLAFAFLDLVDVHRPRAILLENVPGLLTSHGGRDLGALLGAMVELGYGVAWREFDAKHFGVPQRRRRIFILGLRSEADDPDGRVAAVRAAEVLAVGTSCDRHPPSGGKTRKGAAAPTDSSARGTRGSPPPDSGGVREVDGLAGRMDHRPGMAFTKSRRAQSVEDEETWVEGVASPTINAFDSSEVRATTIISQSLDQKKGGVDDNEAQSGLAIGGFTVEEDPLLPPGYDSNRYRCCGNGVVAPVAEWIGRRLAEYFSP